MHIDIVNTKKGVIGYPAFSFSCLGVGVVSLCWGVLEKFFCVHTGVDVSAGLSRVKCSAPDMLKNCNQQQEQSQYKLDMKHRKLDAVTL